MSAVIYESAVPTASMTGVDAVFPVLNAALTEVPEDAVDATALFDSAVTIGTEAVLTEVPDDAVETTALFDSAVTIGTEAVLTEVPEDVVDATALSDSAVTIGTEAVVTEVPEDAVEVSSLDMPRPASEGTVTAVMTGVTGTL